MSAESNSGEQKESNFSLYNLFEEVQARYRSGNENPCYGYIDLSGTMPYMERADQLKYDEIFAARMDQVLGEIRLLEDTDSASEIQIPPQ